MNIGVFFGSRSPEHDVSIITGQLVINGLKELGHDVIPVYIDKKGSWFVGEELGDIEFFKKENVNETLGKFGGYSIDTGSIGKLVLKKKSTFGSKEYTIDLAVPALHGQNGEDGTIQGLFEMFNVPYVGCDVTASALAMDKVLTKVIYQKFEIPTTNFVYFFDSEWINYKDELMSEIKSKLTWPLIVKPARLGSSIGIAKAENEKDLEFAIEVALHYDSKVIVEDCVKNLKDITVAVLGNEAPTASLLQESVFSKDFFSYEDKYLNEGGVQLGNADKKIIIPATLDDQTTIQIKETALKVYEIFGGFGTARVDFLYDNQSRKFYVNEINTIPGTLYHHLWKKSGVELKDLLTKLIEYAQERQDKKEKLTSTFESAILKQANKDSMKLKGIE